jgi:hypothetical protein
MAALPERADRFACPDGLSGPDALSTVAAWKAAGLHSEPREADVADHTGAGTKADPWILQTPPGTSSYVMYVDEGSKAH